MTPHTTLEMYGNNELTNQSNYVFITASFTTPGTHYDVDLTTIESKQN